jgi:hypothetical protein
MPAAQTHPSSLPADQLRAECEMRCLRRSGPGGQHRNKVSTAVALRHTPTGVLAEANEDRSQAVNRSMALFRLRINLALQVRTTRRPDQTPSGIWRSRCHDGRIDINAGHADFPAILAEALDIAAQTGHDIKKAAEILGCTASQLVRLLRKEPKALLLVNDARKRLGLPSLQ